MSLSESLEKFLSTVATSMSSAEQSALVAEIVEGVRALEGLPPKPVAQIPQESAKPLDGSAGDSSVEQTGDVQQ